ncbi:MAG: hypothetical protein KGL39_49610 [Patescibacteria group bacterium]|nr:hypothetical protein [Patescibacteria group bacterium]
MDYFPDALAIVFPEEGPYSNTSGDAGGQTKWGVAHNMHPEITDAQWAVWTKADSEIVLRKQYWDAHRCGEMPWPWALAVFDGVVNQGGIAIKYAQEALGISADGIVGMDTLDSIEQASNENFHTFLALRLLAYTKDGGFNVDGKGWFKRVINIAMAATADPVFDSGVEEDTE